MIIVMRLNFSKSHYFIAAGAAIMIFAGASFYFLDYRSQNNEISQVPGAEAPKKDAESQAAPAEPPPAVKTLPPYTGQPLRELNADPKFIAAIGSALHEKYQQNLSAIADRLEEDPLNHDDWLAVAYIKKLFSNYIGTRDAWEYAKIVNPENAVTYFNLGELYGYELKEPAKAEENYKSALRIDPHHLDYYVGLANFYKDVLKSPEKAEAALLSALTKIPHTEPNLFAQIGSFYRDQKNYTKAIEYFEKALSAATDPGVKKAVENELNYLRSKQ